MRRSDGWLIAIITLIIVWIQGRFNLTMVGRVSAVEPRVATLEDQVTQFALRPTVAHYTAMSITDSVEEDSGTDRFSISDMTVADGISSTILFPTFRPPPGALVEEAVLVLAVNAGNASAVVNVQVENDPGVAATIMVPGGTYQIANLTLGSSFAWAVPALVENQTVESGSFHALINAAFDNEINLTNGLRVVLTRASGDRVDFKTVKSHSIPLLRVRYSYS